MSAQGVVRWTFRDTETNAVVKLPFNPKEASAPNPGRNMRFAWGTYWGNDRARVIDLPLETPLSWTFGGVILTKSHYDLLLEWAKKSVVLRVTDHLGRTFEIIIEKYDPVERLPTATRAWRADYTMTCLFLEEIK